EVMVGARDGHVVAWELATGEKTFESEELRHPGADSVWAVGYLDDGRRVAGGDSRKILVWGAGKPQEIRLQPSSVLPLPGGRMLVGGQGALHVVEADGKTRMMAEYDTWIYGLASSARRDVFVAADNDGVARVWDLATGAVRCALSRTPGIWTADF